MKPYPKTKPSGMEWLGEVPEHWEVVPFKHRCQRFAIYGANMSSDQYVPDGVRFLRTTDIDDFGRLQPEGVFIEAEQAREYLLHDQDILLSRSGTVGRAFVYRSQIYPDCAYAGYLVRFIPTERLNSSLLFYFTKCIAFRDWLQTQVIASTIGNVNGQKYAQCPLPLPGRGEQDSIVAYLDRETGRIDALEGKNRALIERLKEKRTALISRTVTRGLPADLPPETLARLEEIAGEKLPLNPLLKPSGIDWLGDIPEHWQSAKTKRHASILSGFAFPSNEFTRDEADMRLLRGINVGVSQIRWDETVCWNRVQGDGLSRFELAGGELVIGMDRPWVTDGVRVAILSEADAPCLLLQRVAAVRTDRHLSTAFLFRLLSSPMFVDYFSPEMTGVSVPHISPGQIGDFPIPCPPLPEQHAIAAYLDQETAKLDTLVAKVETAIERLQEYRSALITAAVTGKIDVRDSH